LNPSKDNIKVPRSPTTVAQAQAGLVAFGPVGIVVAVGITGITISVWLNTPDGQKFLGSITDVVGRGVDGTIQELQRLLNGAGATASQQLKSIEDFVKKGIFTSNGNSSKEEVDETIADLLDDAELESQGKSRIYGKSGDITDANQDFDKLTNKLRVSAKDRGNGIRTAELPDGSTIVVRPSSREGSATIQIDRPYTSRHIKVRYR
jgi:hypothetical protein